MLSVLLSAKIGAEIGVPKVEDPALRGWSWDSLPTRAATRSTGNQSLLHIYTWF
jgi:hypothetical protein